MRQYMNMIFHAIDSVEMAIFIGQQVVDKSEHPLFLIADDCWFAVFGGVDNVVNQLSVGSHKNQVSVEK